MSKGRRYSIAADRQKSRILAQVLKAIAHPLRIRIVALLCAHEFHVNELARVLKTPQPIVSQQLKILKSQNLVAARREAGLMKYKVMEPQLRVLIRCLEKCKR